MEFIQNKHKIEFLLRLRLPIYSTHFCTFCPDNNNNSQQVENKVNLNPRNIRLVVSSVCYRFRLSFFEFVGEKTMNDINNVYFSVFFFKFSIVNLRTFKFHVRRHCYAHAVWFKAHNIWYLVNCCSEACTYQAIYFLFSFTLALHNFIFTNTPSFHTR